MTVFMSDFGSFTAYGQLSAVYNEAKPAASANWSGDYIEILSPETKYLRWFMPTTPRFHKTTYLFDIDAEMIVMLMNGITNATWNSSGIVGQYFKLSVLSVFSPLGSRNPFYNPRVTKRENTQLEILTMWVLDSFFSHYISDLFMMK